MEYFQVFHACGHKFVPLLSSPLNLQIPTPFLASCLAPRPTVLREQHVYAYLRPKFPSSSWQSAREVHCGFHTLAGIDWWTLSCQGLRIYGRTSTRECVDVDGVCALACCLIRFDLVVITISNHALANVHTVQAYQSISTTSPQPYPLHST